MVNRNCLSYWFPKLQEAGIPVPRTEIVRTDLDLLPLVDGKTPEPTADGQRWEKFLAELQSMALLVQPEPSAPVFLRTGQGSGKHSWDRCCNVRNLSLLDEHVCSLVEWSHLVDLFGLDHDVWVVREFLPVKPVVVLPGYENMPFVPEVRAFVKGGVPICWHPYWPEEAIRDGLRCDHRRDGKLSQPLLGAECVACNDRAKALFQLGADLLGNVELLGLVSRVAAAFKDDGAWSVDVLPTARGLFVTDMAEAHRSYHWGSCPNRSMFDGTPPAPDDEPGDPVKLEELLREVPLP